ncbi:hypothetical protein P8452_27348 [Trifolium repens]|nr:hypothetical protein P8452_27348 [Trifolium repens]
MCLFVAHVSVHQLHELNVIDIVLKELATQLCFNPYLRKPHNLSGVLESWHGFYQRIRSTLIGLSQNVDLSSLGFIEPLAVINTVAQILLQFGPWNMANKLVEIVPSGLVLFNLQKLPVKSVSVQVCKIYHRTKKVHRDMSKIFVPYVGIAVDNGLPLPAKMMCLTSVLDLTPRRNYRCSMILGH